MNYVRAIIGTYLGRRDSAAENGGAGKGGHRALTRGGE